MDVATLAIEIKSTGVDQAAKALTGLEVAGAKAEIATRNVSRRMGLAEIEARKMDAAMREQGTSAIRLTGGLGGLTGALQAVAGAMVVREVIAMADAYKNLHSRLALVTTDTANLAAVEQSLFAISQGTRTSLESNVALYTSLARSSKALGLSQADLLKVTRTVSESFIVSGASASETAGAVRQLGQALASGTLRGDEFNSIAENAPRLQQAVAASLGVTIGQLRTMATEGKLTGAVITKALLEAGGAIHDEFTKIPTTVSGAMTQIRNAMLVAVGATDSATDSTAGLAGALSSIAEAIPGITSVMNAFFGGIQLMAADAGIAVERMDGAMGRFLARHSKLREATTSAMNTVFPTVGPLVSGWMNGTARDANDSADVVRAMEKQRDELARRLTAIGGGAVSTRHGTPTGASAATDAEKKAAKEAEEIFKASIDQRADEYNHFIKEERDAYKDVLDQTVRDFEEAEREKEQFAMAQYNEQTKAAQKAYDDELAAAVKAFEEIEKYRDDMSKEWRRGIADIAMAMTRGFGAAMDAVFSMFTRLMNRMEAAGKDSGFLYRALGIGSAAIGGGMAGYDMGRMGGNSAAGGVMGAGAGAMAGSAFGPQGAVIGALAGFVGGLLGGAKAAREHAKALQDARDAIHFSIAIDTAELAGNTREAQELRIREKYEAQRKAVRDAYPQDNVWQRANAAAKAEMEAQLAQIDANEKAAIAAIGVADAFNKLTAAALNEVRGYKVQAAIFGASTGGPLGPTGPQTGPFRPTGSQTSAMSGDLSVNLVLSDGTALGKVVIRDFKRRQERGDKELASVLAS